MQVAVTGMSPAARLETAASGDLGGASQRLSQAVDWDDDVLTDLASALCGDANRHAVAPAPQLLDRSWLVRDMQRERSLGQHPARRRGQSGRLGLAAVDVDE